MRFALALLLTACTIDRAPYRAPDAGTVVLSGTVSDGPNWGACPCCNERSNDMVPWYGLDGGIGTSRGAECAKCIGGLDGGETCNGVPQ